MAEQSMDSFVAAWLGLITAFVCIVLAISICRVWSRGRTRNSSTEADHRRTFPQSNTRLSTSGMRPRDETIITIPASAVTRRDSVTSDAPPAYDSLKLPDYTAATTEQVEMTSHAIEMPPDAHIAGEQPRSPSPSASQTVGSYPSSTGESNV